MVSIEFTYDYALEFLPIYRELFESEFTGRKWFDRIWCIPDSVLEYRFRQKLMERRKDPNQMDLMVIYYNDNPVGLSFPRTIFTEEEKQKFEVEDFEYYKIGSIVILKEYRNKGIAYEACKLFMERYGPIIYHVDELNLASIKLALKLGLTFSHRTNINNVNYLVYK